MSLKLKKVICDARNEPGTAQKEGWDANMPVRHLLTWNDIKNSARNDSGLELANILW